MKEIRWALWLAQLLHGDSSHATGQGGCSQTELTWQSCSVQETEVRVWEGTIPQLSDWQKSKIMTALSIDRMWENRQAPSHMPMAIQTGKTFHEENLATHYKNYMCFWQHIINLATHYKNYICWTNNPNSTNLPWRYTLTIKSIYTNTHEVIHCITVYNYKTLNNLNVQI